MKTSLKKAWHLFAYQAASMGARCFMRSFMTVRVTGQEHLPPSGAYLLVCNHISHFDPPLLASALWRKVAWVVALDLYAHPVGAAYFHAIDSIPVDRKQTDHKAVREILRRFQKGQIVGLFPEGGIRAGTSSIIGGAELDESVGAIAQLGQVPVIPCVILGADKLYAWRSWIWRTTIDIRFGSALNCANKSTESRAALSTQITSNLRRLVEELKSEFNLAEDDLPKTPQERW